MKLETESVPKSCWGQSLRERTSPAAWSRLRAQVKTEQGGRCAICEAGRRLALKEVWAYDDSSHVRKLVTLRAVCILCDEVEQYERTSVLAAQGLADLPAVIDHFCTVNDVDEAVFRASWAENHERSQQRAQHLWRTDLGEWSHLAELDAPAQRTRPPGWDGVHESQFVFTHSTINEVINKPNGVLELFLEGRTHHWDFRPHEHPHGSWSHESVVVWLTECAIVTGVEVPTQITACDLTVNGDQWDEVVPLPAGVSGKILLKLELSQGTSLKLAGRLLEVRVVGGLA